MKTALIFVQNDLRNSWRDSSARVFLLLPILFFALLHTAVPALLEAYPVVMDYGAVLLGAFVFQGGLMFGFVSGFLLLDEKDLGLLEVYGVAPIGLERFLLLKIAFPFAGALAYGLLVLRFNPLVEVTGAAWLLGALCFAMVTPLVALWIGALGRNKVEGLTWFKGIDLVLVVPLLGFFLPGAWEYVFAVVPTYHGFKGLVEAASDGSGWGWPLLGLVYALGWVWISIRLFRKRL